MELRNEQEISGSLQRIIRVHHEVRNVVQLFHCERPSWVIGDVYQPRDDLFERRRETLLPETAGQ
jgi:hypothetical protein